MTKQIVTKVEPVNEVIKPAINAYLQAAENALKSQAPASELHTHLNIVRQIFAEGEDIHQKCWRLSLVNRLATAVRNAPVQPAAAVDFGGADVNDLLFA